MNGTATALHPYTDGAGTGWVATETRAPVVALTVGMSDFLHGAAGSGIRPLVVTGVHSRLTRPLDDALSAVGGHWIVRAEDGCFEARTGARLAHPADVLVPARGERHPAFFATPPAARLQLAVTAATRHRVTRPVLLGGVAHTLAEELTGSPPTAWGPTEPLVAAWDREQLTDRARRRMPLDSRWAAVGSPDAPFLATVHVARTKEGLEETTRAWADVCGPSDPRRATLADDAVRALTATARHGIPLIAAATAQVGAPDLTRRALAEPAPTPLALLVGAPGVRALGVEPVRAVADLGAAVVGNPRLPGLVFTLGTLDGKGWERLAEVLDAFDPRALARLLDLAPSVAAQLLARRPAGGADA